MSIRPGLISLFNVFIVLVLITLALIGYTNSQNSQELIINNQEHTLTYLEAKSQAHQFVNELNESSIDQMAVSYQFEFDGINVIYLIDLDYQQQLELVYDYRERTIISLILVNESDYQIDDTIPVYKGE